MARFCMSVIASLECMQAASGEQFPGGSTASESVSKTLHIQAAKVVAAHAASVGDNLLAVPLLCSAGPLLSPLSLLMQMLLNTVTG